MVKLSKVSAAPVFEGPWGGGGRTDFYFGQMIATTFTVALQAHFSTLTEWLPASYWLFIADNLVLNVMHIVTHLATQCRNHFSLTVQDKLHKKNAACKSALKVQCTRLNAFTLKQLL